MIRVCIAGITGWVGEPLTAAIRAAEDLQLVAGVARGAAGRTIGETPVFGSVEAALAVPFDVLVDYTSALAAGDNVRHAVAGGRHVVVGSSGLTDAEYDHLDTLAREHEVGVLAGGNFSLSAALLQRFALEAARWLPDVEIIDVAHLGKLDAPSGTARELSWRLTKQTGRQPPVHSVRLPGYTIGVEARFGAIDERLTLVYDGGSGAAPYIAGTLLAIRRVAGIRGVVRGFDTLLG